MFVNTVQKSGNKIGCYHEGYVGDDCHLFAAAVNMRIAAMEFYADSSDAWTPLPELAGNGAQRSNVIGYARDFGD